MKHREIVRPILGDLIMALTDKIFKFVPQRLQAYPCDTSMPAGFSVYGGASSTGEAACPRRSSARPGMLVLSQPRLLERAQLNGLFKGGEPPLWSRAGFKPRSRIQSDSSEPGPWSTIIPKVLPSFSNRSREF